jgi:S-adenosylmethionine:tRNA ribosyltransferase-isomerase
MDEQNDLVSTYDYDLPEKLIAAEPATERHESRLMVIDPASSRIDHGHFSQLASLLRAGDLLVFNNARVIPARIAARKPTGGAVEVFVVELVSPEDWHTETDEITFDAMTRSSNPVRPGTRLGVEGADDSFEVVSADAGHARVVWRGNKTTPALLLKRFGEIPLPPYIVKQRERLGLTEVDDAERYQTVYASQLGAVAAPTAGLHFDDVVFEALRDRGVRRAELTLEVGPGTFRPVTAERLSDHDMHSERYRIDDALSDAIAETRRRNGRVIAVGTTSMRTLEAEARRDVPFEPGVRRTNIFLKPDNPPIFCDGLITNFHLPKSTLLALVASFAGLGLTRRAYDEAVARRYRFYSYGDANLIMRGVLS